MSLIQGYSVACNSVVHVVVLYASCVLLLICGYSTVVLFGCGVVTW